MAMNAENPAGCMIVGAVPLDAISDKLQDQRHSFLRNLSEEAKIMAVEEDVPAIDVARHVLDIIEDSGLFRSKVERGAVVEDTTFAASLVDGKNGMRRSVSGLTVIPRPSLVVAKLLVPGVSESISASEADGLGREVAGENNWSLLEPQEESRDWRYWHATDSDVSRIGVVVSDGVTAAAGITASATNIRPEVMSRAVSGLSARRENAAVVFGKPKGEDTLRTLANETVGLLIRARPPERVLSDVVSRLSSTEHGAVAIIDWKGRMAGGHAGPLPIIRQSP